jgi:hypothetical protein
MRPSFLSPQFIFLDLPGVKNVKKPPKEHHALLEASYGHLLRTPSHADPHFE